MANVLGGAGVSISYAIVAIDKASKVVKGTTKELQNLKRKLKETNEASKKNSNSIAGGFRKMMTNLKGFAVAYAAAFGAKKVLDLGMNFQDSIAGIATITGAAGKDLKIYSDESVRLSQKYGIAAAEIANGIQLVGSAKSELLESPKALIEITEVALKLSKAAGNTVPEAVGALTGALNQFGKGADHAMIFADMLAQSTNVGAAEIPELIESLKMAGSVSSLNNVTFAETNALLQVMAKSGLKGSMAGTGLAGVMAMMQKKVKWDPKTMGLTDGLKLVKTAVESGQIRLLDIFGQEHTKSAAAVMANISLVDDWTQKIKIAGELDRQVAERSKTLRAKLAKVRMKIEARLLQLFEKFEPQISAFVEKIGSEIDKVDPQKLEQIAATINGLLLPLKMIFGFIYKTITLLSSVGVSLGEGAAKTMIWMEETANATVPGSQKWWEEKRAASEQSTPEFAAGNATNSVAGAAQEHRVSTATDTQVTINDPNGYVSDVETNTLGGVKRKRNMRGPKR